MRKIVCLANSWKFKERCIAGIDLELGQWVRPVCDTLYPEDGRIPSSVRLIDRKEPALLDILAVPLARTGRNFGFECENFSVLPGRWERIGQSQPADLLQYCGRFRHILHNTSKSVPPSYLQSLPAPQRRSLQLVYTENFSAVRDFKGTGWRGTFSTQRGGLTGVKITDPALIKKLEAGHSPNRTCLLTISLSMPFSSDGTLQNALCWKLIAGVVEFPLE